MQRRWFLTALVVAACSGPATAPAPKPPSTPNAFVSGGAPRYEAALEARLRTMPIDLAGAAAWDGLKGTPHAPAFTKALELIVGWRGGIRFVETALREVNRGFREQGLGYFIAIILDHEDRAANFHAYRVERVTIADAGTQRLEVLEVEALNGEPAALQGHAGSHVMGVAVVHAGGPKASAARALNWLAADLTGIPQPVVDRIRATVLAGGDVDDGAGAAVGRLLIEWRVLRGAQYLDRAAERRLPAPDASTTRRLEELADALRKARAGRVIERLTSTILRSVRLHELQHVLDEQVGRGVPDALRGAIGLDGWLVATEVSAYLATMRRDPKTLWLTIATLVMQPPNGSPTGVALAVIVDGLARHFDRERPPAVVNGTIDASRLGTAVTSLATRSSDELSRAAGTLWETWFSAKLAEIRVE